MPGPPARPTLDREGETLTVTVLTFPSERSLNQYLAENGGDPAEGLKGQAIYQLNGLDCKIHLIKPKKMGIDDAYTKTLGHELMHCLYGDYHRPASQK